MALQPWYRIAVPREDLRKGEPLDASEFAIHLDQVVDGTAPVQYRDPALFFQRTFLTAGLKDLTIEVLKRLSGETMGASSTITLTTQFGGGKTHGLTALYHLAKHGEESHKWTGISDILKESGISKVPKAAVAVFVGERFDVLIGRGGSGEPKRLTPWGEIAWQLSQSTGNPGLFRTIEEHDKRRIRPGGDVVKQILPSNRPVLILMDEVLNFMSAARTINVGDSTLASQFLQFLQILTTEASGRTGVCLVLSLPKSEQEMTAEDEADFARLTKLASRKGKPYMLSEGLEIAEIIRRRLFDTTGEPKEIRRVAKEYAKWIIDHREQLPAWFPIDQAQQVFETTYPFHPTALSVFERKWQSLPKFQRTRGVLLMLALWVFRLYRDSFTAGYRDPVINLGTAPLIDSLFRAAIFEQLGEQRLEAAVLSDIASEQAHAVRLDATAPDTIKRARLHQKVATTIFFESSGGQIKEWSTLPEIRLAVGEPDLDPGNIETVLDDLDCCYYMRVEGTRYWFSHAPNIKKLLSDRRATISESSINERVRETIRTVFGKGSGFDRRYFPETSSDIPNIPTLTLVVLSPEHSWDPARREETKKLINNFIDSYGSGSRTFKSALVFSIAEKGNEIIDCAKNILAIESLEDDIERMNLGESEQKDLQKIKKRAEEDLKESVWRTYRQIVLLGDDGKLREDLDLGMQHSSAAPSLISLIQTRLKQEGLLEDSPINPGFLVRNWPPALPAWSTRAIRDTFYASPKFPRLTDWTTLKKTIADGVKIGLFGYASVTRDGKYESIKISDSISELEVEFSDKVVLLPKEVAESIKFGGKPSGIEEPIPTIKEPVLEGREVIESITPVSKPLSGIQWEGQVPHQKWMTFYTKVLARFASDPTLTLNVKFTVTPKEGISQEKIDETRASLKELGLDENIKAQEN